MFNIAQNAQYAMLSIIILLVISTLIYIYKKRANKQKDFTELKLRIQSWWWMIAIVFFSLSISFKTAVIFFAFLSFLALKEFLSIISIRHVDRRAVFWAYLSIPLQYYWVSIGWYGMFIIFIPVYLFLLIPIRLVLIGQTDGFIRSSSLIHWAVMLTVFSISHIAYLLVLPVQNELAGAIGPVLFLLFMTQFNDVSQYVFGKMFGKHKIIPKVSPNKTWEGFLGGLVTITIISGFLAPFLTPLNTFYGFIAGFIIGISGFFGDVVISSVKRDIKIKDTGTFIPGHGGILDRLDSLLYTAPLFFHFLYYVRY
ncbi:phosphatidate cytidylyltransferase [Sulfurospirillum arcachonense]|uniref:phosphatidate cytidylyltransferase n=1 Tax=Sulfurospirillum arcachonense TaxID=57666 RepID=UPI00046ACD4D|nr:phosphatidate cytidylyltransferase [Sulfurospirillum arcachonense]